MTSKFSKYATDRSRRVFPGELLKFTKGVWEQGLNRAPVSSAQTFVPVMNTLMEGHIKWAEGRRPTPQWARSPTALNPRTATTSATLTPTYGRSARTASARIMAATTLLVFVSAEAPVTSIPSRRRRSAAKARSEIYARRMRGHRGRRPISGGHARRGLLRAPDQVVRPDQSPLFKLVARSRPLRSTPLSPGRAAAPALPRNRLAGAVRHRHRH